MHPIQLLQFGEEPKRAHRNSNQIKPIPYADFVTTGAIISRIFAKTLINAGKEAVRAIRTDLSQFDAQNSEMQAWVRIIHSKLEDELSHPIYTPYPITLGTVVGDKGGDHNWSKEGSIIRLAGTQNMLMGAIFNQPLVEHWAWAHGFHEMGHALYHRYEGKQYYKWLYTLNRNERLSNSWGIAALYWRFGLTPSKTPDWQMENKVAFVGSLRVIMDTIHLLDIQGEIYPSKARQANVFRRQVVRNYNQLCKYLSRQDEPILEKLPIKGEVEIK